MKNTKMILLWSGIIIELAGIVLIAKSMGSDTSPATGIILLSIGIITMVIGMGQKAKQDEPETK